MIPARRPPRGALLLRCTITSPLNSSDDVGFFQAEVVVVPISEDITTAPKLLAIVGMARCSLAA